jgi:hypothetical protein
MKAYPTEKLECPLSMNTAAMHVSKYLHTPIMAQSVFSLAQTQPEAMKTYLEAFLLMLGVIHCSQGQTMLGCDLRTFCEQSNLTTKGK